MKLITPITAKPLVEWLRLFDPLGDNGQVTSFEVAYKSVEAALTAGLFNGVTAEAIDTLTPAEVWELSDVIAEEVAPLGHAKPKLARAVVGSLDGEHPPLVLRLAWQCKRWEALPLAGGIVDQPWSLLTAMSWASDLYRAHAGVRNTDHLANWSKAERGIVADVQRFSGVVKWLKAN